jgi:hypothetical protein
MEKNAMNTRASAEQRPMSQVAGRTATAEPERSFGSTSPELAATWMSPFFYADLLGLMTYLSIVGGPGPWFDVPVFGVAPAENRQGELPPLR